MGQKLYGRVCGQCGHAYEARRSDKVTCSGKCRMRLMRKCNTIERARKMGEAVARAAEMSRITDERTAGRAVTAAIASVTQDPERPVRPAKKPTKNRAKKPSKKLAGRKGARK